MGLRIIHNKGLLKRLVKHIILKRHYYLYERTHFFISGTFKYVPEWYLQSSVTSAFKYFILHKIGKKGREKNSCLGLENKVK